MMRYTEDVPGIDVKYDWTSHQSCEKPTPPDQCADTGGALVEFGDRGGGQGMYAMVLFVPSSYTVSQVNRVEGLLVSYGYKVHTAIEYCMLNESSLSADSDLHEILDCLDERIGYLTHHRPIALALSVLEATGYSCELGGVLRIWKPELNLDLFILPHRELVRV